MAIVLNAKTIETFTKRVLKDWGEVGTTNPEILKAAHEAAVMEIRASKEKLGARGEATEKKPRAPRKLDEGKVFILEAIAKGLELVGIACEIRKDADISFQWKDVEYTVKLVKHRPPKP